MKIRLKSPLFVIGKPTQQGKKDNTVTYYYVTCSQGEDEAGKIRVADLDVYNRIEKYKEQMFTFEFNDQYNSFAIVDVEPMPDRTAGTDGTQDTPAPDKGQDTPAPDNTQDTPAPGKPGKAQDADKPGRKQ